MADDRRPAQRGPADTTDTDTDSVGPGPGTAGQHRDEFTASDENDLLDQDGKEILMGRRPPLKELGPEQLGK
ncbi:hypothetical protein ACFWTC_37540 [Streptomyces sp. NPDC058619]|uniref:hypothetical protein n=1 Tax=Streptomyces sp. NPDC058619 TaxID=3346559 RepID=UPI0036483ECE